MSSVNPSTGEGHPYAVRTAKALDDLCRPHKAAWVARVLARERFERCCKKWKPVAIWLALRGYLKKDPQVKKGYIQEFSTFLGPEKPIATSKRTLESYLESVFPFLEAHPSIDALTAPPESDEAFRALVKQDEVAHV